MRRNNQHTLIYRLLGLAIKIYLASLYGFLVFCILLIPFLGVLPAYGLLTLLFPQFVRGAVILICGTAIVSVVEVL